MTTQLSSQHLYAHRVPHLNQVLFLGANCSNAYAFTIDKSHSVTDKDNNRRAFTLGLSLDLKAHGLDIHIFSGNKLLTLHEGKSWNLFKI